MTDSIGPDFYFYDFVRPLHLTMPLAIDRSSTCLGLLGSSTLFPFQLLRRLITPTVSYVSSQYSSPQTGEFRDTAETSERP